MALEIAMPIDYLQVGLKVAEAGAAVLILAAAVWLGFRLSRRLVWALTEAAEARSRTDEERSVHRALDYLYARDGGASLRRFDSWTIREAEELEREYGSVEAVHELADDLKFERQSRRG